MTEDIFPNEEIVRDLAKVWSLAKTLKIAMISVLPEWFSLAARPVSATEPFGGAWPMRARLQEGSNVIWFIISRETGMAELNDATPIMLTFSNGGEGDHIMFRGFASICDDRDMLKALWDGHASIHFPQGPEGGQALLMRFEPQKVGRHGFVPMPPAE